MHKLSKLNDINGNYTCLCDMQSVEKNKDLCDLICLMSNKLLLQKYIICKPSFI